MLLYSGGGGGNPNNSNSKCKVCDRSVIVPSLIIQAVYSAWLMCGTRWVVIVVNVSALWMN